MALDDAAPAAGKLAFGAAFRATFATVFGHLWSFIRASLLPLALGILLTAVSIVLVTLEQTEFLAGFVLEILGLVPLVLLGIACSRLTLLGTRSGAVPRPLFGRRSLVYLGYSLLFSLAGVLPVLGFAVLMFGDPAVLLGANTDAFQQPPPHVIGAGLILLVVFYLFYLYFIVRFSLVFPAVAIDRKLGLRGSWRLTRGAGGFKLYALLIVVALLCVVAMMVVFIIVNTLISLLWLTPDVMLRADGLDWGVILLSKAPSMVVGLAGQYFGFLLMIAALATGYAQLSGWGAPRQDVLERFE